MLTLRIILRNGIIFFGLSSVGYAALWWLVRKSSENLYTSLICLLLFAISLVLMFILKRKRMLEIGVMSFRMQTTIFILLAIAWIVILLRLW